MNEPSILLCIGTRPEIIKMAPVYRAFRSAGVRVAVVHTGQHDEMAWPLYEFFGIEPAHRLRLDRGRGSLAELTATLLGSIHGVVAAAEPTAVLVQGDTTTALAGALCGFYAQIPVGHVEAGLRTHTPYDPFPEEKNRELIGRLAHWHFAPTPIAAANLRREGIAEPDIYQTGNTIVDATQWGMARLESLPQGGAELLPAELARVPDIARSGRRIVLVTAHRRENWGAGIESIATGVRRLLERRPEWVVVWPVHANPQVQKTVARVFGDIGETLRERLFLCPPLNYPELLWVMAHAWLILSDSGGIQEEAVSARVPILVLRETTERPELIDAGAGLLIGTDAARIESEALRLWSDPLAYEKMRGGTNPFGDGHAADYIADIVANVARQSARQ